MDSTIIIITICSLLLLGYVFDVTSIWTRIPSVILLLLLGWFVQQVLIFLGVVIPDLSFVLPILGTLGLILIVLESSFDLKLYRSKMGLINKSFLGALLPLVMMAFFLSMVFQYYGGYSLINSLINAVPFCIISSAVAIPSIRHLPQKQREFVIFESSISDILGVLFFNFIALNTVINLFTFINFTLQLVLILITSIIAIAGLAVLLNKIKHQVKFFPIILLIILIYAVFKQFHLPALIFIIMFGLFLANLNKLNQFKRFKFVNTGVLEKETQKFKELTTEATFMIRASFFLLFGFLIDTKDLLNPSTLVWALGIVGIIVFFRIIQLKISKYPLFPLLFIAPRGLISILLFLSIEPFQQISFVNRPMMIQVVVLTAITMMFGLMITKKQTSAPLPEENSL